MPSSTHGYLVNERAEHLVWESLLKSELEHFNARLSADPGYRFADTETLKLYGPNGAALPPELAALSPGVHDEARTTHGLYVALVHDGGNVLAFDISDLEGRERALTLTMFGSTAVVAAALAMIAHLGVGWLVKPLTALAKAITTLAPNRPGARLTVEDSAPTRGRRERGPARARSHDRSGSRVSRRTKKLTFRPGIAAAATIQAPQQVARAAIGNLVRNAVENSDRGIIDIKVDGSQVIIEDPGHGMSNEEMSALYTRLARAGNMPPSAGIGLELIARICEHLEWRLSFSSTPRKGTRAVLVLDAVGGKRKQSSDIRSTNI